MTALGSDETRIPSDGEFYMNHPSLSKDERNPMFREAFELTALYSVARFPKGHSFRRGHIPHFGSANVHRVWACSFTSE